jgi:hypothetical protein
MARRIPQPGDPGQVAIDSSSSTGNIVTAIVSAIALAFSAYSLWETSLRAPDVRAFVPPVIYYASPYQNSNFEVVSIPVTLSNEGARTGTVLFMGLEVTDPRTAKTKRFFASEFGRWTMEKTRAGAYQQFAPMALAGRTSRTETVLFFPRGEQEKPDQIIREVGPYEFKLTLELAETDDFGFLDKLWPREAPTVKFERALRFYDARSFQQGTIPMDAKDWQSSSNAK